MYKLERRIKMETIIEFVVKDIKTSAEFYTKYLGFEIELTEYEPVSWMQLKNGNTIIMLVTYDYAKNDIPGFKEFTNSSNLYKFRYDDLEEIKRIYENIKKDNGRIFLEFRKADYRYEFGVYDEDNNMILVTKATDY